MITRMADKVMIEKGNMNRRHVTANFRKASTERITNVFF
jgi:hypothetical protein